MSNSLNRRRYPPKRPVNTSALRRYEDAKRAWIAANPQASPQDYQKAITAIAARLSA